MSLLITSVLIFINAVVCLAYCWKRKRLPGEPPLANPIIPVVGRALEFGLDPRGLFQKLQKKLGDVYTVTIAGWHHHIIMNPLDVMNLAKCKTLKQDSVVGDFVSRVVGPHHSIHNQQLHDYDGIRRNDAVARAMTENLRGVRQIQNLYRSTRQVTVNTIKLMLDKKLQPYNENNTVNLYELCKDLIFYNTYSVLLGSLPDEEENFRKAKALHKQFMTFNDGAKLLIDRIPMHFLRKTKRAREEILKILQKTDLNKREHVSDIITQVMNADTIEENQLNHLLIFMWTGQANAAPGLFWALYYIIKHPNVQQKIMEEFKDLLKAKREEYDPDEANNNMPERNFSLDDILDLEKKELDSLELLDAILKEIMRLKGHNLNIRKATIDTVFTTHDGKQYKFRKGDHVMYYSPVMHLDPEVFDEPEEFIFDRFLPKTIASDNGFSDDNTTKVKPTFSKNGRRISDSSSVLTFGFGEGKCPGRYLAFMEIKLIILALLACFEAKLISDETPESDISYIGFGVLPPKKDTPITLPKRKV